MGKDELDGFNLEQTHGKERVRVARVWRTKECLNLMPTLSQSFLPQRQSHSPPNSLPTSQFLGFSPTSKFPPNSSQFTETLIWSRCRRPSNNLWIGKLSSSVSDDDVVELFGEFGVLDATSYGSRNYGFVFFKRVEEAINAKESLQGTVLKGLPITVEFTRPAKATKQLWVGGISSKFSKEALEEELIKFGEISDFKFFRDRNTALFEYVQLEDASQAMKTMNGWLLGSEQVRVDFVRSQPIKRDQWAENRDSMGPIDVHAGESRRQLEIFGSRRGEEQPSKILWVGYPPSRHITESMLHSAMILFGEIEKIMTFPSRNYSFVEFRSVDEARRAKEGLQGRLFNDPRITIMFSSSELAPIDNFPFHPGVRDARSGLSAGDLPHRNFQVDAYGHDNAMVPGILRQGTGSDLKWKRPSSPALLQSPASDMRTPLGFSSGPWDVYEANQLSRDAKRSRIEARPINESSLSLRNMDDRGLMLDHGLNVAIDGSFVNVPRNRPSPPPTIFRPGSGHGADRDYTWRGPITKGGQPVCYARCIPIGEGVTVELPEVIDCAARTGLDKLASHYTEGDDFEVVFFLPDSEEDFSSYTEFLRYLGSRDRAGVAKLIDGTSLFLVPPSEFLRRVLKVTGPERLYGVVLTASRIGTGIAPALQQPVLHHVDHIPPGLVHPEDVPPANSAENVGPLYKQNLSSGNYPLTRQSPASYPLVGQSVSDDTTTNKPVSISKGGLSLTPELISSLASLIHSKTPTPSEFPQQNLRPPFVAPLPNKKFSAQGWNPSNQVPDHCGYSIQQPGSQLNFQGPSASHLQHYQPMSSADKQPGHAVTATQQSQETIINSSQYAPISSGPLNAAIPSQNGQFLASAQISQQYQPETVLNHPRGYQMAPGNDISAPYSSSVVSSSHGISNPMVPALSQSQVVTPATYGQVGAEIPNVSQQFSSASSGAAPGTQNEDDKNQRYQSTLQFAANLLLQIQQQQQQQQKGGQAGSRSGNQQ